MSLQQGMFGLLMQRLGRASPLPANLRQCAWIQGDLDSYIVTDFAPTRETIEEYTVIVDAAFDVVTKTATQVIAGFGVGAAQYIGLFSGTKIGLGSSNAFNNLPISQMNRLSLSWANSNGILTCDGVSVTRSANFNSLGNLTVLASPAGSYTSEAKISYVKIEHSGDVVYELVPCYDIYTGDIGMYDLIAEKFYTNAGNGTFSKGADVV